MKERAGSSALLYDDLTNVGSSLFKESKIQILSFTLGKIQLHMQDVTSSVRSQYKQHSFKIGFHLLRFNNNVVQRLFQHNL